MAFPHTPHCYVLTATPSLPCPQVLERITHLSLSHNRLRSLDGITAFVGTCVINLSFNLISSSDDLSKLVLLRRLDMLSTAGGCGYRQVGVVTCGYGDTMCISLSALSIVCLFAGNPISSSSAFRIVMLAKFLRKSRNVSSWGIELPLLWGDWGCHGNRLHKYCFYFEVLCLLLC